MEPQEAVGVIERLRKWKGYDSILTNLSDSDENDADEAAEVLAEKSGEIVKLDDGRLVLIETETMVFTRVSLYVIPCDTEPEDWTAANDPDLQIDTTPEYDHYYDEKLERTRR